MGAREQSEVQRAVASHWLNKFIKEDKDSSRSSSIEEDGVDVVDITSDEGSEDDLEEIEERQFKKTRKEEEILMNPIFHSSKLLKHSPVHVFDTPMINPPDSESIHTFFQSKQLKETFVFSFELDVAFVMEGMAPDVLVTIIAQNIYHPVSKPSVRYVSVQNIITNWSCHHSKLVINFYKDSTMRVYVSTSNFTPEEYSLLGGVFWSSDLLLRNTSADPRRQEFKVDLCNYLKEYKKPEMDSLIEKIRFFDFSQVKLSFVGSTPGNSSGNFGYLKLHQHLKSRDLIPSTSNKLKLLSQVSTIAAPFKKQQNDSSNILTHLLLPLVLDKPYPLQPGEKLLNNFINENNIEPMILFPTIEEIVLSKGGAMGAGCLIYNNISKSGKVQDEFLSKYFYRRNSGEKLKGFVNNHSKIYLLSEDDFQSLNWCFIGSMNLSKSAWGSPTKNPGTLLGNNWECGVLLDPKDYNEAGEKFVPVFNENNIQGRQTPIRLPFKLPLVKYEKGDKLWCRFDPEMVRTG